MLVRGTSMEPTAGSAGPGSSFRGLFRATGDESTLWRVILRDGELPELFEIFGSTSVMQSPAVTANLGTGSADVRYIAYVSDESGVWELRVEKFTNWTRDGDPYYVRPPGTTDNLMCNRNIYHPRWTADTRAGDLRLVVTLSDCPDNGFEDLGFDEQPWATGEVRIWEVSIPAF